jgi:hypothetical protein
VPTPAQSGGLGDDGELAADLPAVQRDAVLTAEDQVVVLPFPARLEPFGGLALAMLPERLDCDEPARGPCAPRLGSHRSVRNVSPGTSPHKEHEKRSEYYPYGPSHARIGNAPGAGTAETGE